MNTRDYKPFVKDGYYHVYNRGNGRQEIFLDKEDYVFFLYRLKEALYPKKVLNLYRTVSQKEEKVYLKIRTLCFLTV